MSRRAKKKHQQHENHERWLITYSDLITLLLVFFVVMYSMSKVDVAKYNMLAQSLHYQFQKSDTFIPHDVGAGGVVGSLNPPSSPAPSEKDNTASGNTDSTQTDQDRKTAEQMGKEAMEKEAQLQNLYDIIKQYIHDNKLEAQVSVQDAKKGIVVTLKDYFLFDLGSANLRQGAYPILQQMASLFPSLTGAVISVEGHTDDLPIRSGYFHDNWQLSYERSLSVLRYFTDTSKLPDTTFQAVAYADTRPIAPNNSEANRQKNRRVEIVVLR
ncbi:OmpA/MotB family protein [Gorillibacterium massiliense]|uniref:OmpA/MotB family protein n=1 Tax=Gorillibacterium massiliense TaxID=1280390 RepID=UPI0004AE664C|nr:flagellar motor protein MotB [Gorillibacterium massiliense]